MAIIIIMCTGIVSSVIGFSFGRIYEKAFMMRKRYKTYYNSDTWESDTYYDPLDPMPRRGSEEPSGEFLARHNMTIR